MYDPLNDKNCDYVSGINYEKVRLKCPKCGSEEVEWLMGLDMDVIRCTKCGHATSTPVRSKDMKRLSPSEFRERDLALIKSWGGKAPRKRRKPKENHISKFRWD